jgi:hypothetical protein
MGTRARVNVFNGNQILVSIYCQFDGYPTGLGKEIADFAGPFEVINGISCGERDTPQRANGMDCFAAQLVGHLKGNQVGNVYLRDTGPESHGEEFVYDLHEHNGKINLTVLEGGVTMFGNPGDKSEEMKMLFNGNASEASNFAMFDPKFKENENA